MRVLVLGAGGMLGHEAIRVLAPDFDVWGACRDVNKLPALAVEPGKIISGLDAMHPELIHGILSKVKPDVVINAIGIVKQKDDAKAAIPSITVNSLCPHVLSQACADAGARMIHVSTDCVFSGRTCPEGGYRESDTPDAYDLYGRSKMLGEVVDMPNTLTMRTSIIGWQLGPQTSLIGWFAAHRHEKLKGYTKAIFSGLTTTALTEVMRDVVFERPGLSGLYHVSVAPIDKYTLLNSLAKQCGWNVDITPNEDLVVDKTLNSERFQKETGWTPPGWDSMLADIASRKPE
ncbi:MAG: SDR family oxidoreductase [Coriobacteriia bacterium]|nr:SDR family oxidoreductase [Coriobacteriia bacterium]